MSLVDAVAAVLEGLEGVAEVRRDGLEAPKESPALVVDLASEVEDEPEELGGDSLILRQTVSITAAVRYSPHGQVAARDKAAALARRVRRTLATNPTLSGACLGSRAGETEYVYAKIEGRDYALALTPLQALIEEAL